MVTNVMTVNVQYPKPENTYIEKIDIYCYCLCMSYPYDIHSYWRLCPGILIWQTYVYTLVSE